jgi:Rrf2 family transcriptional regulator, iron-sulfur cluster assembly transcription factor
MRMSTKGRFAVNSMIDLALREGAGPVALAAIAARQQISLSYLEQLFSRLRRSGLVASTRGPGGGYTLGRSLNDISVADIVLAVEEPSDYEVENGERGRRGDELTGALWDQLGEVMLRHLGTVSLKSMVDDQLQRGFVAEAKPTRRPLAPTPAIKPMRTSAPNSVFAFGQSFVR